METVEEAMQRLVGRRIVTAEVEGTESSIVSLEFEGQSDAIRGHEQLTTLAFWYPWRLERGNAVIVTGNENAAVSGVDVKGLIGTSVEWVRVDHPAYDTEMRMSDGTVLVIHPVRTERFDDWCDFALTTVRGTYLVRSTGVQFDPTG